MRVSMETLTVNTRLAFAIFLLSSICFSQTTPARNPSPAKTQAAPAKKDADANKQATPTQPPAPTVGENETVITVQGVCPAGTPAESCSTKITRAEFEKFIAGMNPQVPAEARRSVANNYGQLMALADQARKMGVDKEPNVQMQMMFLLAQGLQKKIFENNKPTAQEVESYHAENSAKYEELNLRRIVVLKSANGELKLEQLKALANDIRERAAAGEDPDKLQVEAYKTAKSAGTPPSTSLGWKRRGGMDPRHEPQIQPLHAGEVSPV